MEESIRGLINVCLKIYRVLLKDKLGANEITLPSVGLLCWTTPSTTSPEQIRQLIEKTLYGNVITMAYVEWSSVLLESSFDGSRSPYFCYPWLWWVTVCCPEHRIFITLLCENLLLGASYICCSLNDSMYTFRGQKYTGFAEWRSWEELS